MRFLHTVDLREVQMPSCWSSCALMEALTKFYNLHVCNGIELCTSVSLQHMICLWPETKGTAICMMQEDESAFLPLEQLHHSAEVTGSDSCLRRPIIATCSLDRSVRLWNYLTRRAFSNFTCTAC